MKSLRGSVVFLVQINKVTIQSYWTLLNDQTPRSTCIFPFQHIQLIFDALLKILTFDQGTIPKE